MLVKNKLIYMIISCIIILRIIYKLCSGWKELQVEMQVEMQVGKEAAINVLTLWVVCKMTLKSTLLIFMCFFFAALFYIYLFFLSYFIYKPHKVFTYC